MAENMEWIYYKTQGVHINVIRIKIVKSNNVGHSVIVLSRNNQHFPKFFDWSEVKILSWSSVGDVIFLKPKTFLTPTGLKFVSVSQWEISIKDNWPITGLETVIS